MKKITLSSIRKLMFFKIPAAYLCGVRPRELTDSACTVSVKYRWINQNPFRSMYFAVQSMAAELTTGLLLIKKIQDSDVAVSMLITQHSGIFTKKAVGKIHFVCNDGTAVDAALAKVIETKQSQTLVMQSTGIDENGDTVSSYTFEWSLKLR